MNMTNKTENDTLIEYQNPHFFRRLLLVDPIIITQKYSFASFLAGQFVYKKFKLNYDHKETSSAIACHSDDFFHPDNKKVLKDRDLLIVEPWFSLEEILKICRYAKSVFFASSFQSHYRETQLYKKYFPDNLNVFLSTKEELVKPIYRAYFDDKESTEKYEQWFKTIQRDEILSYGRAVMEREAVSHEHFHHVFTASDIQPELEAPKTGEDYSAVIMEALYDNIVNESFSIYSKKQDLNILYMATKPGETPNYDVFLRKAIGSESPKNLRVANVLVTFTITRTMVYYTLTRIDGETNVLKAFAKHEPVGNEQSAFVVKPLSVVKTGLVLKL